MHENELPFINGGEHIEWAPDIPIWLSLGVIVGTLVVTTVASLVASRNRSAARSSRPAPASRRRAHTHDAPGAIRRGIVGLAGCPGDGGARPGMAAAPGVWKPMSESLDLGRPTSGDVLDLILDDHRRFEALLRELRDISSDRDAVRRAFAALHVAHAEAEEPKVYPTLRRKDAISEHEAEHGEEEHAEGHEALLKVLEAETPRARSSTSWSRSWPRRSTTTSPRRS